MREPQRRGGRGEGDSQWDAPIREEVPPGSEKGCPPPFIRSLSGWIPTSPEGPLEGPPVAGDEVRGEGGGGGAAVGRRQAEEGRGVAGAGGGGGGVGGGAGGHADPAGGEEVGVGPGDPDGVAAGVGLGERAEGEAADAAGLERGGPRAAHLATVLLPPGRQTCGGEKKKPRRDIVV